MGQLNKLRPNLNEAIDQEDSMVKLDLVELIQYLEQSVILVGHTFSLIP